MVLNDAGVIGLTLNGKSFPATAPVVAKQGEWVEIHYMNEGLQIHPMHLHGMAQLVIAKDGFPMPAPYQVDTLNVAPGRALHRAGARHRARRVGVALPHPQPRRGRQRDVRHGDDLHRPVSPRSSEPNRVAVQTVCKRTARHECERGVNLARADGRERSRTDVLHVIDRGQHVMVGHGLQNPGHGFDSRRRLNR